MVREVRQAQVIFDPELLKEVLRERAEINNVRANKVIDVAPPINAKVNEVAVVALENEKGMHIKSVLREVQSFAELEPLITKAKAKLSFWGDRYISVVDYEGKLPIDAIATKVLE